MNSLFSNKRSNLTVVRSAKKTEIHEINKRYIQELKDFSAQKKAEKLSKMREYKKECDEIKKHRNEKVGAVMKDIYDVELESIRKIIQIISDKNPSMYKSVKSDYSVQDELDKKEEPVIINDDYIEFD